MSTRIQVSLLSLLALALTVNARGAGPSKQSSAPDSANLLQGSVQQSHDYRVVATKKTSTMEKELNEAADTGYRFFAVMGGETGFGGSEVVVIMGRTPQSDSEPRFQYKLLATNKTSTMQKEIQEAADGGFQYVGQTVFSTTFGGNEVVVIMERDRQGASMSYEYKLLATNKTSTLQKELLEAGEAGFEVVGLTVAETAFGGSELVGIVRRERAQ